MIKLMILCTFFNVILVYLLAGSVTADCKIDVFTKKNGQLVIDNYGTMRNWYCIINNQTCFVLFFKWKHLRQRFHYYANCQSTFNPTILSTFLLKCGDIHPNLGPTFTDSNSTHNGNRETNSQTCLACT